MATRFEIPLSEPCMGGNENRYVLDALARNEIAQGGYIPRFEGAVADYIGVRHAVAVSSGTAALHLALLAAGVGPGDEVLVPALTFIATANAVRYCGATPVFVDVEPETWGMDPLGADAGITERTKALLPVHLLGHPCSQWSIDSVAVVNDLLLIEDAAEALGATIARQQVGALGNIACLSFNGNKLITTGGGGMVVTDNDALAVRVRYLANQAKDDPAEYVHKAVGYNYRMSNIAAAIGCAQMERLPEFLAKKRAIAERYAAGLADVPGITLPREAPWARSSWWLYTIRLSEAGYGVSARGLRGRLAEAGIESRTLWQPLHLSPAYAGSQRARCPVAERIWREALSLPSSVGLTEEQQERVIKLVRDGV